MYNIIPYTPKPSWNKGKLVGQKLPLKLEEVWSIRTRLDLANNLRELTMFNLALDCKLRACDFIKLKVMDIAHGKSIQSRAILIQQKTGTPVRFEITKKTQESLKEWIALKSLRSNDYLFGSRMRKGCHLTTRQYARIVKKWIASIGLDVTSYGTHSMRRTKASLIYKKTKNLRAVQILLGHTKLESTVRYLGIEVDDALELSEAIDI
ncbi:tyrosine-type recombinase/integrase [Colwellia sp. 1_MG-2023]|uniref:tyrosine-type recombinase/integrase n=1 Tax=unclassified Colwellia TaxID=196834 RepID=UPI001C097179|nr:MULTISPECIES: tyrosine-type recombinase/integrase [unclassified Colwellia]MBU2925236.1 tyrosine-type recombinase/integrase [Colwellia sp. C2M11]MDO6651239.1 tyrosine-type recombinase/integrase [Colwellia sp. 3_MG-2023]MDO6664338.1 tyrosine-type recombinase/integrase [Colwellia sp. 2_MG-2023]MDO6688548.1 tyrosine-type recombinase/integrase [Colwellia sp. 1_MG-2023]